MNKIIFLTVSAVLVMMASAAIIPITLPTTGVPLTPPLKTGEGIIAPESLFPTTQTLSEDTKPCYRFLSSSLQCILCFP